MLKREKKANRFHILIVISLLLHTLILLGLWFFPHSFSQQNQRENIEISFVDEPQKVEAPKNLPEPLRVVETDSRAANNEISEKAKFLSEKNNTVEKETRAKFGMKFKNSAAKTVRKVPGTFRTFRTPQKPNLFQNFDAYAALNQKQEQQKRQPAANAQQNSQDASATNDSLDGVDDSLITRLNTREYKYYSYYSRIKSQLNQWWVPKVQEKFSKMLRQGRSIASEESKITKLVIVLNNQGLLVKVKILAASGERDLDDAAVEAFRSAAPFPNPPKGMVEKDGTVQIRWDCVVES